MLKGSSQRQKGDTNLSKQSDLAHSPLHLAVIAGDEKAVEILLSKGADRSAKELKHGNTPLHEAAWRGYSRCIKILCSLPLKNSCTTNNNKSGKKAKNPKTSATRNGENELFVDLLSIPNAGGFSALHLAAQNGHNQSCREILLAGANPNVQNNYGDTPLHTACRYGHAGATRILLSAKSDPLSLNLNYDTPLHIACAMGRRKLTRILFEVCGLSSLLIKNAQGETARDIALRKNLKPIVDILNAPPPVTPLPNALNDDDRSLKRDRNRSSSSSQNHKKEIGSKAKTKKHLTDKSVEVPEPNGASPKIWSPYGCHYFPDPRTFPPPKLETLPKEPLSYGEQYFLDLAGNIRKGPVGIGNTCYCGPFFSHIEQQINQNKKSFKKYVLKGTSKLDGKKQGLASQTGDKIQRVARSILADKNRDRCPTHFENWPRRSDPLRATVAPHISRGHKDELNNNSLSRCRSLELLGDKNYLKTIELDRLKGSLHRSYDLLNSSQQQQHEAIIHHSMTEDVDTSKSSSVQRSAYTNGSDRKVGYEETNQILNSQYALDFREKRDSIYENQTPSLADSLEDFSSKTNEIIKIKRATRRKLKEKALCELRDRKSVGSKYPAVPSTSHHTGASNTADIDETLIEKFNRLTYRYPNDYDDISDEMKNITKLLGSSLEPFDSATAASSSNHYNSNDKFMGKCSFPDNRKSMDEKSDDDDEADNKNDKFQSTDGNQYDPLCNGGFFQNTCFEDLSSSSCYTLKSIDLAKNRDILTSECDDTDDQFVDKIKAMKEMGTTADLLDKQKRKLCKFVAEFKKYDNAVEYVQYDIDENANSNANAEQERLANTDKYSESTRRHSNQQGDNILLPSYNGYISQRTPALASNLDPTKLDKISSLNRQPSSPAVIDSDTYWHHSSQNHLENKMKSSSSARNSNRSLCAPTNTDDIFSTSIPLILPKLSNYNIISEELPQTNRFQNVNMDTRSQENQH